MCDHPLLDLFGVDGAAGTFGDVYGATADQRTATGACAQFRQSHPYGHRVSLSLPVPAARIVLSQQRIAAYAIQRKTNR
jgi:hypothetical protein